MMGDESERIGRLEQDMGYLREALDGMKNSIDQILAKLDSRYPTKEMVDMQIKLVEARTDSLEMQVKQLQIDYVENANEHKEFNRTIAKAAGAVGAAAFVVGIVVTLVSHIFV